MNEPWLNQNHPNFSIFIFICVTAWKAILGKKNKKLNEIEIRDELKKWLDNHNVHYKDHAFEAILDCITPDRIKKERELGERNKLN